jgi:hypothetical protein
MNNNLCGTLFDLFDEKVVRFLSGLLGGGILPSSTCFSDRSVNIFC